MSSEYINKPKQKYYSNMTFNDVCKKEKPKKKIFHIHILHGEKNPSASIYHAQIVNINVCMDRFKEIIITKTIYMTHKTNSQMKCFAIVLRKKKIYVISI